MPVGLQVIYLLMAAAIVGPSVFSIIGRWMRRRDNDKDDPSHR